MTESHEDILAPFCEKLLASADHGDDIGGDAKAIHDIAAKLFGVESEATAGWERELRSNWPEEASPSIDVASVVPVSDATDTAFVTTILERTMLYSGFTALVMPVELSLLYTSYSANESIRGFDRTDVDGIIEANLRHESLVTQGRCAFVPASSTFLWGSASSDWKHRVEAPLLVQPSDCAYFPLNRYRPAARLEDALWVYKRIVLPYLPGVDLEVVASAAENESEAFRRFNSWLGRALSRLSTAAAVDEIDGIFEEIDEQVEVVSRQARRIGQLRSFRNFDIGIFVVSLAAAVQAPEARELIAGFFGTSSFLDLMRNTVEVRAARQELRQSAFFVPWFLQSRKEG